MNTRSHLNRLKHLKLPADERILLLVAALVGVAMVAVLAGCSTEQQARLDAFEAKAGPKIAEGCAVFRRAEASPLVEAGAGAAAVGIDALAGGLPVGGLAVAALKGAGDAFCRNGPPAGDPTSEAERAAWIIDVGRKLAEAAGKP